MKTLEDEIFSMLIDTEMSMKKVFHADLKLHEIKEYLAQVYPEQTLFLGVSKRDHIPVFHISNWIIEELEFQFDVLDIEIISTEIEQINLISPYEVL